MLCDQGKPTNRRILVQIIPPLHSDELAVAVADRVEYDWQPRSDLGSLRSQERPGGGLTDRTWTYGAVQMARDDSGRRSSPGDEQVRGQRSCESWR